MDAASGMTGREMTHSEMAEWEAAYAHVNPSSGLALERGLDWFGTTADPGDYQTGRTSSPFVETAAWVAIGAAYLRANLRVPPTDIAVARWGRPGLQSSDWVMKGGANYRNYVLSGKWQPGFTNQFAPYACGEAFVVPSSSVIRGPGFWGTVKYPLGQRMYVGPGFPPP
ncbi:unnamed protein product [marine sediment metagenome]|uniref:Uncharacterized protein n=1 Tax=marine sediment metagenome TaxID=412755 RepID=X0Y843_9ZZZZ